MRAVFLPLFPHYFFSESPLPSSLHSCANTSSLTNNLETFLLWHNRFGHASASLLQHLPFLSHLRVHHLSSCPICPLAKQSRLPFPPSQTRTYTPFDLIHLDLWGLYRHCSSSGAQYTLTTVDDYSRATWTYLLPAKSQTFSILTTFFNMVSTRFHTNI